MDKETALILSEMLIKQDETTTHIKETNKRLDETNSILKEFMGISKEFMGTSVKQWDQQQKFNERFFDKLEDIEKAVNKLSLLEGRVESLEERLMKVENMLKAS